MGGTIIGAGVFAVPAAMRQSGILRGTIAFWVVALAILSIHLIYSEVVLRNKTLGRERFPGQVRALLGSGLAKKILS
jgi:amino acid permease